MKSKSLMFFISFCLVLGFVFSGCGPVATPSPAAPIAQAQVNQYPPYQSIGYQQQRTDDAKVRYILIDIQLTGNADYYRQYISQDSITNQAVQKWDQGIRVVNIYQFQRINNQNQGWLVVYGGTNNIVIGSDVVLTQDIGAANNGEARIRYILADCQLGSVIDYYRQYTNDPLVAEAVSRWDQGVRVVNINNFERKIISDAGWKIVYAGTENMINGMDVILTTDQTENATVPQPGNANQCTQLNLTPEECANLGTHHYMRTMTVTGNRSDCSSYNPSGDIQQTWSFPITHDQTTFIGGEAFGDNECKGSASSNGYSFSCSDQNNFETENASLVFTANGVVEEMDFKNSMGYGCHLKIELTLQP
jgi:hypothetical protein